MPGLAVFATLTPVIAVAGVAERARLLPILVVSFIWSTIVYCPIAYSTWNSAGWGFQHGDLDFAGGGPVHITSGTASLIWSLYLGRRRGYGTAKLAYRPHSVSHVILGTCVERSPCFVAPSQAETDLLVPPRSSLIWFGWCVASPSFVAWSPRADDGPLAAQVRLQRRLRGCDEPSLGPGRHRHQRRRRNGWSHLDDDGLVRLGLPRARARGGARRRDVRGPAH